MLGRGSQDLHDNPDHGPSLPLRTTNDYRAGMLVQHAVACVGHASEPERAA